MELLDIGLVIFKFNYATIKVRQSLLKEYSKQEYLKMNSLPNELVELLSEQAKTSGLVVLLSYLLQSFREISDGLRNGHFSSDAVGTQNTFGDQQLDVDVKADAVIFHNLKESKLVHVAASEENPLEITCNGEGFSVAFDPLDGSSIIDANFAVGSIVGIWSGNGLLNRTGRDIVASMIAQYGPRVTVALSFGGSMMNDQTPLSLELTMLASNWIISIPKFTISVNAKTFAPGNLRATQDNPEYAALVNFWISSKYTLRYSGGLVPDVYHILIKKEGVLSNASSKTAKAKLRLLFEAAPIAFIIEGANGSSCVCPSEAGEGMSPISLLDVQITDLDKRVGVCYGSTNEVERFKSHIFGK